MNKLLKKALITSAEWILFALFIVFASAMDSENVIIPVAVCLVSISALLWLSKLEGYR